MSSEVIHSGGDQQNDPQGVDEISTVQEDDSSNEGDRNPEDVTPYRVYPQRWWVLLSFSWLALWQCAVWNAFGPVDAALRYAYGWSDATVAVMADWGTVTFLAAVAPLTWALQRRGLRCATLAAAAAVAIGSGMHAVTTDPAAFTALAHVGAVLNGVAGVTVMSVPTALSAAWFPPSERTTATTINQVSNMLGSGVSSLLGPYLVPDNTTVVPSEETVRDQLRLYMQCLALPCLVVLGAMAVYFPSCPASPPSASSAAERTDFAATLPSLLKSRDGWLVALAYAAPCGVGNGWSASLPIILQGLGVDESEAGYLNVCTILVGTAVSLLVARLLDRPGLKRRLRAVLVAANALSALFTAWLMALCLRWLPFSRAQLWPANLVSGGLAFANAPLAFEYAAELCYPAPEGVVAAFMATLNNAIACVFLSLFLVPFKSHVWLCFFVLLCTVIPVPLLLLTSGEYRRLQLDVPEADRGSDVDGADDEERVLVQEEELREEDPVARPTPEVV